MSSISRCRFSLAHWQKPLFDLSLCVIANYSSFQDKSLFFSQIRRAVQGGATCVQYRDHESDMSATVKTVNFLMKDVLQGVPLFVNTLHSCELIQTTGAHGLFLEEKTDLLKIRKLLGKRAIIGTVVRTMEDVMTVGHCDAIDYISVKVFPSTRTCPRKNDATWGLDGLRTIRRLSPHRISAVGGLTLENVKAVYRILGLTDGVAMAGGIMSQEDPFAIAQKIGTARHIAMEGR